MPMLSPIYFCIAKAANEYVGGNGRTTTIEVS